MAAKTIRSEYLALTGAKAQGKNEEDNAFIIRLLTAVSEKSESKAFDKMSEDAQNFYQEAGTLINDGKEEKITGFPDEVEAETPKLKLKVGGKPALTVKGKAAKPAKEKKEKVRAVRTLEVGAQLIAANPKITKEAFTAKLEAKGAKAAPSYIAMVWGIGMAIIEAQKS